MNWDEICGLSVNVEEYAWGANLPSQVYGMGCNVDEQTVLHANKEQKRFLPVTRATSCMKISAPNATPEQTRKGSWKISRREHHRCMWEKQVEQSLKGARSTGGELEL